ncbi:MAG: hypothetical protein N2169_06935 [bacterium]|nr:hypothetical protein [bacterium]
MGAYIANPLNLPVNPVYDPSNIVVNPVYDPSNIVDISKLFRTSQIFQQILLCLGSRKLTLGELVEDCQPGKIFYVNPACEIIPSSLGLIVLPEDLKRLTRYFEMNLALDPCSLMILAYPRETLMKHLQRTADLARPDPPLVIGLATGLEEKFFNRLLNLALGLNTVSAAIINEILELARYYGVGEYIRRRCEISEENLKVCMKALSFNDGPTANLFKKEITVPRTPTENFMLRCMLYAGKLWLYVLEQIRRGETVEWGRRFPQSPQIVY